MGYIEIAFIFVLSFIIIGPKDFPKVMFWIGDWVRRIRFMADQWSQRWAEVSDLTDIDPIEDSVPKKTRASKTIGTVDDQKTKD